MVHNDLSSVGNFVVVKASKNHKGQQLSTSGSQQVQYQCIIKGALASEGGSSWWRRRHSVSLHSNLETKRSGRVQGRVYLARFGGGGFATKLTTVPIQASAGSGFH